jgi:carbon-monoxide dehydrogenase large subunit
MKRMAVGLAVLLLVGLTAGSAVAQAPANVAGKWELSFETPQGTRTSNMTLEQDGEKIKGKMAGRQGEIEFTGTIKGNELKWSITRQTPNGEFTTNYSATVDGDSMKGKMSTPGGEREFTAKRLKE